MLICRGTTSQVRLQQRGARTQTGNKRGEIKSCPTFIRSISDNQAAGEMEEDGEGTGGSGVGTFTKVPRSLSLAAAREVSVRRSPARTRWPPGFQCHDPAHIMEEWQMTSCKWGYLW